jgi:hypothetical protein
MHPSLSVIQYAVFADRRFHNYVFGTGIVIDRNNAMENE